MKLLFAFAVCAINAQTTPMEESTTTKPAHNPEAQDYCHNSCRGTPAALPSGNCMDGFYPNPNDCSSYFVCWDQGKNSSCEVFNRT